MLRRNKHDSILVEQYVPLFNLMDNNLRVKLMLPRPRFKLVGILIGVWIATVVGGPPAHALCTATTQVCAAKTGVFAIQSFHPAASATRIGPDLLVTNRHVVANQAMVQVLTPNGARLDATVVPSSYPGDLIMLQVPDLPPGPVLVPGPTPSATTSLQTIGYDVGRQAIRIYAPGQITAIPPAKLQGSIPCRLLSGSSRTSSITALPAGRAPRTVPCSAQSCRTCAGRSRTALTSPRCPHAARHWRRAPAPARPARLEWRAGTARCCF